MVSKEGKRRIFSRHRKNPVHNFDKFDALKNSYTLIKLFDTLSDILFSDLVATNEINEYHGLFRDIFISNEAIQSRFRCYVNPSENCGRTSIIRTSTLRRFCYSNVSLSKRFIIRIITCIPFYLYFLLLMSNVFTRRPRRIPIKEQIPWYPL